MLQRGKSEKKERKVIFVFEGCSTLLSTLLKRLRVVNFLFAMHAVVAAVLAVGYVGRSCRQMCPSKMANAAAQPAVVATCIPHPMLPKKSRVISTPIFFLLRGTSVAMAALQASIPSFFFFLVKM